ncbi:uncharacterized protein Z519_12753 [Cladophialophora bantiana CBS 173.52]|uniref:RRM domain-containing protein n=1 Tax=Cladophialophora bantiana (strain ATCC 10958 / CBS 173.52 / CDC B-1940 / NIH 8579) TaxID=1442370 RepID=A0A0D2H035_CLAB1|nr:uncharacterized protein Z519_12753 [Cladophialophora bantiana CBS 173.52]KIW86628.1 hypothetical protein Z519_12753 [Cladophialophora bantiana CBS 173.52]
MSKVKSKAVPPGSKPGALSKVKGAAVTKPSQSVKAKSKVIAKEVAAKEQKKDKRNKKIPVKEPTPESESSSEEESSEEESEDSTSSEEDSESEDEVKTNSVNGVKVHGQDDAEEDSSESDSEASAAEDVAPNANGSAPKAKSATDASESEKSSEEESDEEESSDESESDEEPAAPKTTKTTKENGVKPVDADAAAEDSDEDTESTDESSDEDQSSGDSDESEDSDEEEAEAKPAKRKAEDVETPAAKKTKVDNDEDSKGSILFVGNLSWNVDEEWLKSEFEEFGELGGVRLITQREDGRSKGYGYVEFVNAPDAAKAHAAKQGYELDGRVMNVDFANKKTDAGDKQEKRRQSYGDKLSEPSDTLFLGNLSFEITEDDVYNVFAPYGTPTGVRIPTDKETGNVKGYGYVTFPTLDEAKAALEGAQGSYVKNRPMRVDYAQPRQQNGDTPARSGRGGPPRGGRGGGRDFGGRGGRGGRGGARGGARGGRGGTTNRGGFGDFSGKKTTF